MACTVAPSRESNSEPSKPLRVISRKIVKLSPKGILSVGEKMAVSTPITDAPKSAAPVPHNELPLVLILKYYFVAAFFAAGFFPFGDDVAAVFFAAGFFSAFSFTGFVSAAFGAAFGLACLTGFLTGSFSTTGALGSKPSKTSFFIRRPLRRAALRG